MNKATKEANAKHAIEMSEILVNDITLLFLCKTATKKTLWFEHIDFKKCSISLDCEIDENIKQCFVVVCENESDAKELEKKCIEWLNY